jgi:hypothetical protein
VGGGSIATGKAVAHWQASQMSWKALEDTQHRLEVMGGGASDVITKEMATRYNSTRWQSLFDNRERVEFPGNKTMKNDIKIDVRIDPQGRVFTSTNSMDTRTEVRNLNRGSVWDDLR